MTLEPRDPDADLVRACRDPNDEAFEPAFEELYRRYADRVYSIAYRITGNAVDAMDAVQECFSLLFRKVCAFRNESLFSTWLFRLVVNCSIDTVRARAARQRQLDGERPPDIETAVGNEVDPASAASKAELGGIVQQALNKISPKLRAALALRYLEGMSYEELCVALDVSMGTVKSRLARAHVALENVLRNDPAMRVHFEEEVA
ncbi:MAG TPA: sigma-70 family RNA polymerase sigma factor [Planctomycetota bacterium]|nr:sigma-70 family RNA polymerase sigma factor [Planctomycetota bacterium]